MSSQLLFSYLVLDNLPAYGIVSEVISCDSTNTYVTVTGPYSSGDSILNRLYLVDFDNQSVSYLCDTPGPIYGAATPNEYLASDCSVRLDLDADDFTVSGSDYQAQPYCGQGLVAVADTDAVFYSGYRVDSLRIRLLPPAPDGAAEYLSVPVTAPLGVSGQNSHWLTLHNLGGAKALDFQTAICSVRWHHTAPAVTPGPRQVEFIAFASGGRGDTALAVVPVPVARTAGRDTAVAVCADGPPFTLLHLLSPSASPGGSWSPHLPASDPFDPASAASTLFRYILPDHECPGDTAIVDVLVWPRPVFSLGPDQSFCAGDSIMLGPVSGSLTWHDGYTGPQYAASQPGLYWAETTDAHGCRFRDSVALTRHEPTQNQETLARCFGQPYLWHSTPINADTLLCDTLVGTNGCDSTYCLTLSFYYPALTVDTTRCSGQALSWQGQMLSTAGNYQDTLLLDGCLTAVNLHLAILPPIVQPLGATVCAGDTFVLGNQSFTAAGLYQMPFQTPAGCDSIVQLQLSVQPAHYASITANICPGEQYPWPGPDLTEPGTYIDTLPTAAGCDSVVTLTLGHLPPPAPLLSGDTLFCPGEATVLEVGPFATYAWSTGAATAQVTVVQPGSYTVTVTAANGCMAMATTQVNEYPAIVAIWDMIGPLCPDGMDGTVVLESISGGWSPFLYQLNQGPAVPIPEFPGLAPGPWTVMVSDAAGCQKIYTGELANPGSWMLDLGASPTLEKGEAYSIPLQNTGSQSFIYAWSPTAGLSCPDCQNPIARPDSTTNYMVTVTDADGCTKVDSLTIRVRQKAPDLYVPTAFWPDESGRNDYFTVFGDPQIFQNMALLRIYDRWGSLVFEKMDLPVNEEKAGWDGRSRGKNCLPGIYTFYAEVRLRDGALLRKVGEVLLVR